MAEFPEKPPQSFRNPHAEHFDVNLRSVARWVAAARTPGGRDALAATKARGRAPIIAAKHLRTIFFGRDESGELPQRFWTLDDIALRLADRIGLRVHRTTLRRHLERTGFIPARATPATADLDLLRWAAGVRRFMRSEPGPIVVDVLQTRAPSGSVLCAACVDGRIWLRPTRAGPSEQVARRFLQDVVLAAGVAVTLILDRRVPLAGNTKRLRTVYVPRNAGEGEPWVRDVLLHVAPSGPGEEHLIVRLRRSIQQGGTPPESGSRTQSVTPKRRAALRRVFGC